MEVMQELLVRVRAEGSLEPVIVAVRDSHVLDRMVAGLHEVLRALGFQPPYPSEEQLLATLSIMTLTLILYYVFFGKRHLRRRQVLADKLAMAERKVAELEMQMDELDSEDDSDDDARKPVRVWMDGAFDMMHYGHMNAFRQGRAMGTYLVVGINSDESIRECKGTSPVMNDEERCAAVKGCKWVDEIVPGAPYVMTPEYLNYVIKEYDIDYVVHGDDPCIVDGKDVYADAKQRGIYRSIPRTEGVSTTDIVGRMLYLSRDHHEKLASDKPDLVSRERKERKRSNSMSSVTSDSSKSSGPKAAQAAKAKGAKAKGAKADAAAQPLAQHTFFRPSRFLTTSRMLRIFSAGTREPPKGATIVYIDGAWDMFHMGHVKTLQKAREMGDYLIVGVHGDRVVNKKRGKNYPIMNLNERLLSVLGCRYVNDVLIDAPWHITREMIASLGISIVAKGTVSDSEGEQAEALDAEALKAKAKAKASGNGAAAAAGREEEEEEEERNYTVPLEMDILRETPSTSTLSVQEIVSRILTNEELYKNKVNKKMAAEGEYYSNRYGFQVEGKDAPQ